MIMLANLYGCVFRSDHNSELESKQRVLTNHRIRKLRNGQDGLAGRGLEKENQLPTRIKGAASLTAE